MSHNSSLTGPTSTQRARDHANDLFSLNFKDEPWNYMYTVHSRTLKRCTFATDGHDPFIYDSDIGRYVPVEELVLSLSKGPEGEPALSAVEGGAAGAEAVQA